MIVCLCRVVTERTVNAAIARGAESVEDLARACRAGTGCGACKPMLQHMLDACASGAPGSANGCEDCPRAAARLPSPYLGEAA